MSILTVENLSKSYFGKTVLDRVQFHLDHEDRLALIGDNGCGKTTLLRIIAGLETPDSGSLVSLAQGRSLAYLEQQLSPESDALLPLVDPKLLAMEEEMKSLEMAMAERPDKAELLQRYGEIGARFEQMDGWNFHHRMEAALAGLGLERSALHRPLASLSGGERMRVALARILLREPDLLLLDEPTNHLDTDAVEWLEHYLQSFRGSVVVVSHDRRFLDASTQKTAELKLGEFKLWAGNYSRFRELEQERNEQIQKQIQQLQQAVSYESKVAQTMLSHRKMASYHSREKKVGRLSGELQILRQSRKTTRGQLHLKEIRCPESESDPRRVLLEAKKLRLRFPDAEDDLFRAENLLLRGQEKIFITGPNGCGKSSFLKLLGGDFPFAEGELRLDKNLRVGFLGQIVRFPNESGDVLSTLLERHGELGPSGAREKLAQFAFFDADLKKSLSVLSGGERARLYLCILLEEMPELLLLDEPTNHLDIRSRETLEKALSRFSGSILAVSHDRYFIEKIAEAIWGFVGREILVFPSYQQWRAQVKIYESNEKEEKKEASASALLNAPADALQWQKSELSLFPELIKFSHRPRNRGEERRFFALLRDGLRRLEEEAAEGEERKQEMEASFSTNSEASFYEEYAALSGRVDAVYQLYMKLDELLYARGEDA